MSRDVLVVGEGSSQASDITLVRQRLGSGSREDIVSAVCRHLLAATGKRAIVRRDDILPYIGKGFKTNDILSEANARLEEVFGLNLVQLSTESKNGKSSLNAYSSQPGASRMKSASVNRAYILTNVLVQNEEEDDYEGDDEEHSFFGMLTVVVALLFISPNSRLTEEKLLKSLNSLGVHHEKFFQGSNGKFNLLQDLVKLWYLRKEQVEDEIVYSLGPRVFKELDSESMIGALEKLLEMKLETDYRLVLLKRWDSLNDSI